MGKKYTVIRYKSWTMKEPKCTIDDFWDWLFDTYGIVPISLPIRDWDKYYKEWKEEIKYGQKIHSNQI